MQSEVLIEGYRAIAVALSEAYGRKISFFSAFRLATRKHDPLPVEGYAGRSWIRLAVLHEWVARNRLKARQVRSNLQTEFVFSNADKHRAG